MARAPAPADLFVVGRFNQPGELVRQVSEWANVPISLSGLVQSEWPGLHKTLRLDAPIDVAAALDPDALSAPEPLFAVSLPLSDYQAALEQLRQSGKQLERVSKDMQFVALGAGQRCVVARSTGPTPARLVCSEARKHLDVLAAYMATTLPTEDLGPDPLRIELRAAPLRARFGKKARWLKVGVPVLLREVSLGNKRFDRAIADAAHAVADEALALIEDADKIVLRAETASDALKLHFGFVLAGQTSWAGHALAARAADVAPASDLFWRLPADAQSAQHMVASSSPDGFKPIVDSAVDIAAGAVEHFGFASPPVERLLDEARATVLSRGPVTTARGPGAGASSAAPPDWLSGWQGYTISGARDGGRLPALIESAAAAFNHPSWRKPLAERLEIPGVTKFPKVRVRPAAGRLGLPDGAKIYDLELTSAFLQGLVDARTSAKSPAKGAAPPSPPVGPVHLHAVTLVVNGASWVAMGSDEKLLAAKLVQVLSGPETATLASRGDLGALRSESVSAGGFTTAVALVGGLARFAKPGTIDKQTDWTLMMPHRGTTAILAGVAPQASGPSLWFNVTVPRAAMEDLAAASVALAAF